MNTFGAGVTDRVVGLDFCSLSQDEIRRLSVTDIYNKETSERTSKDRSHTLNDGSTGVTSDPQSVCLSCGEHELCPGHYGRIDLAVPCFSPSYMTHILKILRVLCWNCSKPRINFTQKLLNKLKCIKIRQDKIKYLIALCKTVHACTHCKSPVRKFMFGKKNVFMLHMSNPKQFVNAQDVFDVFKKVSDADAQAMGITRPENMIITSLIVPPPVLRPQVLKENGTRSEEPLTFKLSDVIKANNAVNADPTEKNVVSLQYYVASFIDSNTVCPASIKKAVRKNTRGMTQAIGGKEGIVRMLIMGSRADFSARSVVESDPNLKINQVGVPQQILFAQFFTETATVHNIEWLQTMVDRGHTHPLGARHIFKFPIFQEIDLKTCPTTSPERQLAIGDKVERYYRTGDWVHLNRQPTLHGPSIQGMQIVAREGKTICINSAVCTSMNADFDGDELNLHFPQTHEAAVEVMCLMNTNKHVINITNSNPIIYPIQDTILGMHLLIKDPDINHTFVSDILMACDAMPSEAQLHNQFNRFTHPSVPGKDLFSLILPEEFGGVFGDKDDDDVLVIADGRVQNSDSSNILINKSVLASGHGSIIHRINECKGSHVALEFMFKAQKMAAAYLLCKSFSIGPEAIDLPRSIRDHVNSTIQMAKEDIDEMLAACHAGTLPRLPGMDKTESLEVLSARLLNNKCINAVSAKVAGLVPEDNKILTMVKAKSKGSATNMTQSGYALFQQNFNGKRPVQGWKGRVLTSFPKFSNHPQHLGMVANSFSSGLTGPEFTMTGFGGRGGLIDTACNTAITGYAQRRLTKGLEGVVMQGDLTLRNHHGHVILFNYGGNSFHPAKETRQKMWIAKKSLAQLETETNGCVAAAIRRGMQNVAPDIDNLNYEFIMDVDSEEGEWESLGKGRVWYGKHVQPIHDYVFSAINIPWLLECGGVKKAHPQNDVENSFEEHNFRRKQFCVRARQLVPCLEIDENTDLKVNPMSPCSVFDLLLLQNTTWMQSGAAILKKFGSVCAFWDEVWETFKTALCAPGEPCGFWAALAIGEPSTQFTLNTFHSSGLASGQNLGLVRVNEIINCGKQIGCPLVKVYMDGTVPKHVLRARLSHTTLSSLATSEKFIGMPPMDTDWVHMWSCVNEDTWFQENTDFQFVVRVKIPIKELKCKFNIVDDVVSILASSSASAHFVAIDEHPVELGYAVILCIETDVRDWVSFLKFENTLMSMSIAGIKGVGNAVVEKIPCTRFDAELGVVHEEESILVAKGSNIMDIMCQRGVDARRTYTNDINAIFETLGIEAARAAIEKEIIDVLDNHEMFVNEKHIHIVSGVVCFGGESLVSFTRFGINRGANSTAMKASFEESVEMFSEASAHNVCNKIKCVPDHIFFGMLCKLGTGVTQVDVDASAILKYCSNHENQMPQILEEMSSGNAFDEFAMEADYAEDTPGPYIPQDVLDYLGDN